MNSLGVHSITHLVTENPPGTGIHDAHQVEPPLLGPDVGEIAHPELVNRINEEVPFHEIIALPSGSRQYTCWKEVL